MWSKRKMSSFTLAKFVCERPRKTYDNLLNIYPTLTLGPVILWFLYLYHSVNYTNARKCCEAIPQIPGKWRHLSWPLFQIYSMAAPRPHPPPTPRFCTDSVPSQIFSPFILLQNYEKLPPKHNDIFSWEMVSRGKSYSPRFYHFCRLFQYMKLFLFLPHSRSFPFSFYAFLRNRLVWYAKK